MNSVVDMYISGYCKGVSNDHITGKNVCSLAGESLLTRGRVSCPEMCGHGASFCPYTIKLLCVTRACSMYYRLWE